MGRQFLTSFLALRVMVSFVEACRQYVNLKICKAYPLGMTSFYVAISLIVSEGSGTLQLSSVLIARGSYESSMLSV